MGGMPRLQYVFEGSPVHAGGEQDEAPDLSRVTLATAFCMGESIGAVPCCHVVCSFDLVLFAVIPSNSAFDQSVHLAYSDVHVNSTTSPSRMEVPIKV